MRPYIAVIRDSFHAALASRVLWVAFVAIWLLLAALAPFGYREDLTTTFRGQDFDNGTRMKAMLAQGLVDPERKGTATARLAEAMPDEVRRQLQLVGEGDEVRIQLRVLADALNGLLDDESWYDAEAWKSTLRFKELRDLDELASEELDESTRRRRARLRIEAALPGVFETRSSRSIFLTYAGMDFPADLAVDKTQFTSLINQWVLPFIIDWLLGFVFIFLGILVTSSVIPDMLQPGSLHLLLSKPVSRTMLLLAKFFGGCAFVMLCVIQLVVGLYLVAGIRLDVWNPRLLWCIPVSVFLFSVYYSVSALASLRWRSPILAIAVTTIFGTVCLVVGIIGGLFDGFVKRPDEIRGLAIAGEQIFAATEGGGLIRYDEESNRWDEIFESSATNSDRILTPIALGDGSIGTAEVRGGRFNPFGSGPLDLIVLSEANKWEPEPSLRLPAATSELFRGGDSIFSLNTGEIAMTSTQSVLEAAGEAKPETDEASEASVDEGSNQNWLSKLTNMMGGATSGFTSVLPPQMAISPPRDVLVDPAGEWIIAMSRGRLVRLEKPSADASAWTMTAERLLDGEASLRSVIAHSGDWLMVARSEQPVMFFDIKSLEPADNELPLDDSLVPQSAESLGDSGRFALVTSDARCRIIEVDEGSSFEVTQKLRPREIEAVHLNRASNELYVAHHIDRLDVLDATSLSVKRTIRPELVSWRMIDAYGIAPLRMIIPQTGELGETTASMVSGKSAISFSNPSGEEELIRYEVFRPVLSCSIFIIVMLSISCVYFSTRDF